MLLHSVDLQGKILDAHPSLGPIFFIFMQFSGHFNRIGWHPFGVGASLENHGSAPTAEAGHRYLNYGDETLLYTKRYAILYSSGSRIFTVKP